ncbi:MAG: SDR family oxidoreductase, partial [bacterium]|nr:SDR family oxidoreductase [bacterium]
GVMRSGKIHELTVADWDLQYAVNIKGPFLVTKAVLPAMMAQKQGILIYISSTAALISPPGNACYASTKWGLDGMTGSFARELCEYGIKCHTLRPGYVDTHLFDADSRPTNPEIDWIAPEEIANCIEFLCRLPAHAQVPDLNYTTTYQRKKY